MSATQERTETLEERVARLTVRLEAGFQKIGEAMSHGIEVDRWEEKWVELLREYEGISDEIAAHHAEVRQQAEMAGMPRRELVTAGRPTIDRGWKTRQVTGAMVSVAAPHRAGTTKGQKQDG